MVGYFCKDSNTEDKLNFKLLQTTGDSPTRKLKYS